MVVTRDHFLPIPRPFLGLRLAQLLVAITVLGMSAYGVHYLDLDGFCLSLFTAIATIIIVGYLAVCEFFLPVLYNYWAVLGLDIFGVIFWLASFALTADEASDLRVPSRSSRTRFSSSSGSSVSSSDLDDVLAELGAISGRSLPLAKRDTSPRTYKNVMSATAGMGGLAFLLFVASLVLTGIYLHRHRRNGGHCMPNSGFGHSGTSTTPGAATASPSQTHTTAPGHTAGSEPLSVSHPSPEGQPAMSEATHNPGHVHDSRV